MVLVLAVSGCAATVPSATPAASSASAASSSPSAAPTSSTWPTVAASPATVPAELDLGTIGFWTHEQPMAAVDLSLTTLRVGTLDGRVTRTVELHNPGIGPLNLPLQPQPVGPAGGRMLYVADDGDQASLHVVSAGTGADAELLTTSSFIAALALDPSGTTAYAVALDRTTGVFVSVLRVPTLGGAARPIIDVTDLGPDATTPYSPEPGLSLYPRLAVSTDGRWVALASCRPSVCDLVAAPTNGGELKNWSGFAFDEQIVGIADDLLIGLSSCAEALCDGFVVDLRTGDRAPLGGPADALDPEQLITGPHGPVVLGYRWDPSTGDHQVQAMDLTDRTRTLLANAQVAEWRQAELPPGWFLIVHQSDGAPSPPPDYSAVTLDGTTEVPLPVMSIPVPPA